MFFQQFRKPRLILALVVFVLAIFVLWRVRSALAPFVLGLVIAYLILPLVNLVQRWMPAAIQRRRMDRPLAILVVYLVAIAVVAVLVATLAPPLLAQFVALGEQAPALYERGRSLLNEALTTYQNQIPLETQQMIETNLRSYASTLLAAVRDGAVATLSAVTSTISWLLGLIVIPFWLFFILNDEARVTKGVLGMIPSDLRADVEAVRIIGDRVLSAYIRGQLVLAVAIFAISFAGLLALGVQFSLLLALVAGVFELLPYIGPILGAIPAVIVAFLQGGPTLALWVILFFIIVQQVENVVLAPKITGDAVALHPAMIMVVLVIGNAMLGLLGMLIAVPLTAVLRDVVHYFYLRAGDEVVEPLQALAAVGYADSATPVIRGT